MKPKYELGDILQFINKPTFIGIVYKITIEIIKDGTFVTYSVDSSGCKHLFKEIEVVQLIPKETNNEIPF